MPLLVVVLFVAVVIGLLIYNAYAAGKRRQELAAWAARNGLRFSASNVYGLDSRYAEFQCLSHGDNRYGYNIVEGEWAKRPLHAFDYHYETHSTDSKGRRRTQHHHFSAAVISSAVPLKPLFIRPEGFMDKVGEFFGMDDIDFESAEFSRRFFVKAPDRKWAFDVLHQRTIEFLLPRPQFHIQFGLRCVMIYRDSTFAVEDFESAVETVNGILDRFPEYLVQQQQSAST